MIKKALTSLTMSSMLAVLCFQMAFGPTALHAQQRTASVSAIPGQINAESLKHLHISPAEFASLQPILEKLIQFYVDTLTEEPFLTWTLSGFFLALTAMFLYFKKRDHSRSLNVFVTEQNVKAYEKYTAPMRNRIDALVREVEGLLDGVLDDIDKLKTDRLEQNKRFLRTEIELLDDLEDFMKESKPDSELKFQKVMFRETSSFIDGETDTIQSVPYHEHTLSSLERKEFIRYMAIQKYFPQGYFTQLSNQYQAILNELSELQTNHMKVLRGLVIACRSGVNVEHVFEGYDSLKLVDPKDIDAKLAELSQVTQLRRGTSGSSFNLLLVEYNPETKVKLPEGLEESLNKAVERVEREAPKINGGGVAMFMTALAASTHKLFQNRTIESGQQSFWDRKLTRNMPREDRDRLLFELMLTFGAKNIQTFLQSTSTYPAQLRSILGMTRK